MNKKQFLAYIDHFNNKRYDAVTGYFTPDVSVEYFSHPGNPEIAARTLHGPAEFMASYKALHEQVREVLELRDFMVCEDLLFAELYTEFHCFKDRASDAVVPLKKGEVSIMTNWVVYNMTPDDKMKRIRIAHFRMHDPAAAKF